MQENHEPIPKRMKTQEAPSFYSQVIAFLTIDWIWNEMQNMGLVWVVDQFSWRHLWSEDWKLIFNHVTKFDSDLC